MNKIILFLFFFIVNRNGWLVIKIGYFIKYKIYGFYDVDRNGCSFRFFFIYFNVSFMKNV